MQRRGDRVLGRGDVRAADQGAGARVFGGAHRDASGHADDPGAFGRAECPAHQGGVEFYFSMSVSPPANPDFLYVGVR